MPDNKKPNNITESTRIPIYKDWMLFMATILIVGFDQLTKYSKRFYELWGVYT